MQLSVSAPPGRPGRPGPAAAVTVGDHVIRVMKLLHAGRHRAPRPHPQVDPLDYPYLFRVHAAPCRVSDLATAFHAEISTVSRTVSQLVDLGLMSKGPDPRDGRAQVLTLTPEGAALIAQIRVMRDQWVDSLLADWSPQERDTFASLLGRFADAVEQSSFTAEPDRQDLQTQSKDAR